MKRYILFPFAFALGWLCLESGQALNTYTESDTIDDVPLAGRSAHVGYKIVYDPATGKIHVYQNINTAKECQKLCQQWGLCAIWFLKNNECTLVKRRGFQTQELTALRISGDKECSRDDGCIKNGVIYHSGAPAKKTIKNVADPFACQDKCTDENGCTHFTWSMHKGSEDTCWLHGPNFGKIASGTQSHNGKKAVDFVSGAEECDGCYEFHQQTIRLQIIENSDGSAYVLVNSHFECQEHCDGDDLCYWFEWLTNLRKCYKYHPWANLVAEAGTITGFRNADLECSNCTGNGLNDPTVTTCDLAGNCICKANYADKFCTKCGKDHTKNSNGDCIKSG